MQDRYVGDIGDFVKYALLRVVTGESKLGVAWYLCSAPGSLDTSLSHAAGLFEIAACHA